MMRNQMIGAMLTTVVSAAVLSGGMPAMASAPQAPQTTQDVVMQAKEDAAKRLATAFSGGLATETRAALDAGDSIALSDVASPSLRSYAAAVAADNAAILQAKGLPDIGNIMEVRLANPETRSALAAGTTPLIAAEPGDDATSLTAIRPDGTTQIIDGAKAPSTPVLIVGYNGDKAMTAGMRVLNDGFKRAWPDAAADRDTSSETLTGGKTVTQIKNIRLEHDEEPWFKGGAEIFALVSGMDKNNKPFMSGNVELTGVDDDKTTYTPNKNLIDWSKLGYDDASAAFLEEDSGTNYKAIVQLAIQAVGTAAGGPTGGAVAAVINVFISLLPDDLFTDTTDDVDEFHSLHQSSGNSGTQRTGVRSNARIVLQNVTLPA
ncbi:DUF3103 family protein [Streptomyces sp. NPDC002952]|uniref:DUF3103 family protein n=1 Tax=Streptomyces sp. NPDC002952 TaxID=3364673 RepID=UPI0036833CF4